MKTKLTLLLITFLALSANSQTSTSGSKARIPENTKSDKVQEFSLLTDSIGKNILITIDSTENFIVILFDTALNSATWAAIDETIAELNEIEHRKAGVVVQNLVFKEIAHKPYNKNQDAKKVIHFETGTFADMLAKAKEEKKLIMVDAFTTWCGPCKLMDKNVFTNDTVAEFYNKHFINAKFDMEAGEGIDLTKKYEVTCYPTFLFIDGNGELMHRMSGLMPVKKFIELGASAMIPEKQFGFCEKVFNSDSVSPADMIQYITLRKQACMDVTDELARYFSTQKEEEFTNQQNWSVIRDFINDTSSTEFQYLISHRTDFDKLYTAEEVSRKIEQVYSSTLYRFIYKEKPDVEGYKKMKERIMKLNLSSSEKIIFHADMAMYETTKDWQNFAKTALVYVDKYSKDNYGLLNNIAWNFYENISDKAMLAKAEEWAKHSVELHPEYFNWDTYAALLYKNGKKAEAQSAVEKAIELAKKEGKEYDSTKKMLEKIKKMK